MARPSLTVIICLLPLWVGMSPTMASEKSDPMDLYYEAQYLETGMGDFAAANEIYNRLISTDISDETFLATVILKQGINFEKMGYTDRAKENFQKIIHEFKEADDIVRQAKIRIKKLEEDSKKQDQLVHAYHFNESSEDFLHFDLDDAEGGLAHNTNSDHCVSQNGSLKWRTRVSPDSSNYIYLSYDEPRDHFHYIKLWIKSTIQPAFLNIYIKESDQSTYDVGYFEIEPNGWVQKIFTVKDFQLSQAYNDENGRIDFHQIENIILEDATGYHDMTTGHPTSFRGENVVYIDDFVIGLDGLAQEELELTEEEHPIQDPIVQEPDPKEEEIEKKKKEKEKTNKEKPKKTKTSTGIRTHRSPRPIPFPDPGGGGK